MEIKAKLQKLKEATTTTKKKPMRETRKQVTKQVECEEVKDIKIEQIDLKLTSEAPLSYQSKIDVEAELESK